MSDDTDNAAETSDADKPRPRRNGLAAIAIIVAIVALAVAAWSVWRLQHVTQADQVAQQQVAAQVAKLQSRLAAGSRQAKAGNQRIDVLESNLESLRSNLHGLGQRTSNLETALANINGRQASAHDTLLLNDAEMLLRAGQQRFSLFHDRRGALKAYTQAIAVLAEVQNPAYAPVRVSAITERDALAAAAPASRQSALDTLSALRGEVASLPLATSASTTTKPAKPGFWSRVAHAFSGIVKVTRAPEHGAPRVVDARFARQTLALDLAQAQEAMLAFDRDTWRNALQRAQKVLTTRFDTGDNAVKAANAQISRLLAQPGPGPAPQLGGALAQLRSLRAQHTPVPVAPASAASSGNSGP